MAKREVNNESKLFQSTPLQRATVLTWQSAFKASGQIEAGRAKIVHLLDRITRNGSAAPLSFVTTESLSDLTSLLNDLFRAAERSGIDFVYPLYIYRSAYFDSGCYIACGGEMQDISGVIDWTVQDFLLALTRNKDRKLLLLTLLALALMPFFVTDTAKVPVNPFAQLGVYATPAALTMFNMLQESD